LEDVVVDHIVDRNDLEARLTILKQNCKDPKYGLFGPDSMYWRMGKESILYLGSGYALLMQEAHPWVSTGAHHHSTVKKDPFGRWKRTFETVNSMIYGDLETALKYARMTHNIHSKVKGKLDDGKTNYVANHEDALFWVAATLAYTTVNMYETGVEFLSREEKEKFYEEFKLFCFLFGISESTIPKNWHDFMLYYDIQTSKLQVTDHARELVKHFTNKFENKFHPLHIPSKLFMGITAHLLPVTVAEKYGFKIDWKKQFFYDCVIYGIAKTYYKTSPEIRRNPNYRKYMRKFNHL
jgi:uncharacterized protein (DUF2236 family)